MPTLFQKKNRRIAERKTEQKSKTNVTLESTRCWFFIMAQRHRLTG